MKRLRIEWPEIAAAPSGKPPPWRQRLLWLAAIWLGSVLALLAVAGLLRWALLP